MIETTKCSGETAQPRGPAHAARRCKIQPLLCSPSPFPPSLTNCGHNFPLSLSFMSSNVKHLQFTGKADKFSAGVSLNPNFSLAKHTIFHYHESRNNTRKESKSTHTELVSEWKRCFCLCQNTLDLMVHAVLHISQPQQQTDEVSGLFTSSKNVFFYIKGWEWLPVFLFIGNNGKRIFKIQSEKYDDTWGSWVMQFF